MRVRLWDIFLSRGHTFVATGISESSLVIDAGSHKLEFASDLSERFNCTVISIEPNTDLARLPINGKIKLISAALSCETGEASFVIRDNLESSSLSFNGSCELLAHKTIIVEQTNLSKVMDDFGITYIDLLKLDIEGAEYDVLNGLTPELSEKIAQITVEFHPSLMNQSEIAMYHKVIDHMSSLGFFALRSSFSGFGDVLFLNLKYFAPPGLGIKYVLPYLRKFLEIRLQLKKFGLLAD